MAERVFAVVTLADVADKVNAAGQAVIDGARHSLDGTQIILDFNHHQATIDGLFLAGTDVAAVITGCTMLSQAEAAALMTTPQWQGSEP